MIDTVRILLEHVYGNLVKEAFKAETEAEQTTFSLVADQIELVLQLPPTDLGRWMSSAIMHKALTDIDHRK